MHTTYRRERGPLCGLDSQGRSREIATVQYYVAAQLPSVVCWKVRPDLPPPVVPGSGSPLPAMERERAAPSTVCCVSARGRINGIAVPTTLIRKDLGPIFKGGY